MRPLNENGLANIDCGFVFSGVATIGDSGVLCELAELASPFSKLIPLPYSAHDVLSYTGVEMAH